LHTKNQEQSAIQIQTQIQIQLIVAQVPLQQQIIQIILLIQQQQVIAKSNQPVQLVTCPEGTTTITSTPPAECPHSPYTDFVGGLRQNGAPTFTCTSLSGTSSVTSGPDANNNCTQTGNTSPFAAATKEIVMANEFMS
jgi:ABC-type antimicrobial peptide transport system ATPase subunit